jgi:RNA polymerase sigma factor (sigma-70 family)
MTTRLRTGISALFRRLSPPNAPDAPADAALLTRFVHTRDEPAFGEIVRRHGAMVLSVCRRRLGHGPDADDAYQVTFLALARDAGKVGSRESLAGWLYRVAHLTALKMSGRVHRHRPDPLTTDPTAPMTPEPDADLKAVIDQELAALPDRFRGVAVLCLVEGLTNAEAADRLGLPKGTVDSRLHTAKAKLRDRLLKRGVAAAAVATLDTALRAGTVSASVRAAALATELIPLALNYAAGVPLPGSEHLTTIANGVKPTMTAISMKWLATAALTAGLLGSAAGGIYRATAGDTQQAEKKTEPKKAPKADDKTAPPQAELRNEKMTAKTADDVQQTLKTVVTIPDGEAKLGDILEQLEREHGLTIRIDTAAFRRRGWHQIPDLENVLEKSLVLKGLRRLPLEDGLREILAQLSVPSENGRTQLPSYRIKGNQILIVPEYQPAVVPGGGNNNGDGLQVSATQLIETMYGEPVTVRYKNRPLTEVIEDLQERTGANIVLNASAWNVFPDAEQKSATKITANFNDTRLLTVLKVVGNMCDLKPVVIDNVYYLTDEASAAKLQQQVDRDLFGEPPPAVPAGFVTDGYKLFPKTADMKPAEDPTHGLGGGVGGLPAFRAKPVPAPEKK